jgi:hypothetical protein
MAQRERRASHADRSLGVDQSTTIRQCHARDINTLDHQDDTDTVVVVGHWLYASRRRFQGRAIAGQTIVGGTIVNRAFGARYDATTTG